VSRVDGFHPTLQLFNDNAEVCLAKVLSITLFFGHFDLCDVDWIDEGGMGLYAQ